MKAHTRRSLRPGLPGRRHSDETHLLAMLRTRLRELRLPADGLSDDDLRQGIRRVARALDTGRLTPEDIARFRGAG